MLETVGRKYARLATNVAVGNPRLWRVVRPLLKWQFDLLAPKWRGMLLEDSLASYEAGLPAMASAPERALDLGTGPDALLSAVVQPGGGLREAARTRRFGQRRGVGLFRKAGHVDLEPAARVVP